MQEKSASHRAHQLLAGVPLIWTLAFTDSVGSVGLPVSIGPVWTTDAPYRETQRQFDAHAGEKVLAVEMQAASPVAFSHATGTPVGVVALVSNAVDHTGDAFNKGPYEFGHRLIETMCRSGRRYLGRR